jgi:tRNA nucleotidyltransferase (CCA-adding enzyme)
VKPALCFDEVLAALPPDTAMLLQRIASASASLGIEIHLVGGPVRDLLLGQSIVDVDLMVAGDARSLADAVVRATAGDEEAVELTPHDRFGTVSIACGGTRIDLAQLRHETYPHPGALPVVEAGTLEQDVRRRDFTVNALVCPLDGTAPSKRHAIVDLAGGLVDLEKRRLRILHPRSFHDDPTRAFRAARFAGRLGFSLGRRSRNALRDAQRDGAFGAVSGERYLRELQLCFEEARRGVHVGQVLRSLSGWHVLSALEPGLTLASDRLAPLRRLSRSIATPDWLAPKFLPWVAGLSIWLAPLPAAQRRRVLERFSVRGAQAARIVRFGRDADRHLRALARAHGRGAVDAMLSDWPEETVQALFALAELPVRRRILRWGAEDRRRRSPVAGTDLTELGLAGPEVGRVLARIRAGFLDGEIANREEALALAEEIAKRAARRDDRARKGASKGPGVAGRNTIPDTPARRRRSP